MLLALISFVYQLVFVVVFKGLLLRFLLFPRFFCFLHHTTSP